jgi:predicted enzyme related to lactoylglutathione lyase
MAQHGYFYWNELMTHDVDRARRFYQQCLGWSFDAMQSPTGDYWFAKMGDEPVGGLFRMEGPDFVGMPEQWVPYVSVDDVDSRVKQAVMAGAKIMREPFDVPEVGRIAILRDPGGALIAWMTPQVTPQVSSYPAYPAS